MAVQVLSDISSALSQEFASKLARQANREAILASALATEGDAQGNAKNVAWDVMMDGQAAGSYAEGDDVASGDFSADKPVPATLSWGHYRSNFWVSMTQFDAAAQSAGSASALIALFEEKVMSAGSKLASAINSDLWSGDGTDASSNPSIVGLHGGALETSGFYANVDRSTYALWKGNILSNGGVNRSLTVDLMEQMDQNIFSASGAKANLIVTSPGVFRKYKGLFESVRRVEGTGPISRYDTSTSEIFFQGIPILRDKDAPAGTMTFLYTPNVKKVFLPISSVSGAGSQVVEGAGSNGDGESSPVGLPFQIVPLAKTGDSLKFMVKCVCQMKVTRPNSCGYIKDILES